MMTKRDDYGPRQRGAIDHGGRVEPRTPGERISEDQTPLSVGVDDLNRLAGQAIDDVTRFRGSTGMLSDDGTIPMTFA